MPSASYSRADDVHEPKLEKIKIADIKLDPNNPNQMTPEQMRGLEKSIKDFGNVAPVIVDQHNNIIDGEHRILIYRDRLKLKEIPAFRVRVASDAERLLMRQTLNKLKGFLDPEKDVQQILQLQQQNLLGDLSQLIAVDTHNLERLIESVNVPPGYDEQEAIMNDANTINDTMGRGAGGDNDETTTTMPTNQADTLYQSDDNAIVHTPQPGSDTPYMLTFQFKDSIEFELVASLLRSLNPRSMKDALVQLAKHYRKE